MKHHIVTIGGGTGLYALLTGLREEYPTAKLSAVVSMMDSGGSTGRLRDEYGHLPPGDVRQCLVALSEAPEEMRKLMQYRFPVGELEGHSFGNLMITALKGVIDGSADEKEYGAIEMMERILNIRGKVYPITLQDCHIMAELSNDEIIRGESNIDVPKHDPNIPIRKLWLDPKATLFKKTRDVLLDATTIIIGPGDLYTSIIPNLLVEGIVDTLKETQKNGAKIVYIVNTMTKNGETNGYTANKFVQKVHAAINPVKLDWVIVNNGTISEQQREAYAAEHAVPVENDLRGDFQIIEEDLISKESFARHSPERLAKAIRKLL